MSVTLSEILEKWIKGCLEFVGKQEEETRKKTRKAREKTGEKRAEIVFFCPVAVYIFFAVDNFISYRMSFHSHGQFSPSISAKMKLKNIKI